MKQFTILHLSDLHYCKVRRLEFIHRFNSMSKEIIDECNKHGIIINAIFITGDLVADTKSYNALGVLLHQLLDVLKLTKDKLYIIPGEHDLDYSKVTVTHKAIASEIISPVISNAVHSNQIAAIRNQRREILKTRDTSDILYKKYNSYHQFINKYANSVCIFDKGHNDCSYIFIDNISAEKNSIKIVGFNTVLPIVHVNSRDFLITREQILNYVSQKRSNEINICLSHVPLDQLDYYERIHVQEVLVKNTHLYFHGHVSHSKNMCSYYHSDSSAMVNCRVSSILNDDMSGSFNIISIDTTSLGIYSYPKIWDAESDKWIAPGNRNEIGGRYFFDLKHLDRFESIFNIAKIKNEKRFNQLKNRHFFNTQTIHQVQAIEGVFYTDKYVFEFDKFLDTYNYKDWGYIHGRDEVGDHLVDKLKNEKCLVLFGDSGCGKSSLIKAVLFPRVVLNGYIPFYIECRADSTVDEIIIEGVVKTLEMFKIAVEMDDIDLIFSNLFECGCGVLLAFDQFEQLTESSLFSEIKIQIDRYISKFTNIQIIIGVRNEFLQLVGELDVNLLKSCYRVDDVPITSFQEIISYNSDSQHIKINEDVAFKIIDELKTASEYKTSNLHIIIHHLLLVANELGVNHIDLDFYNNVIVSQDEHKIGVRNLLAKFLDSQIGREDGNIQSCLKQVLANLVSSNGIRIRMEIGDLLERLEFDERFLESLLSKLQEMRLIRVFHQRRVSVELSHEVLITRIIQWETHDERLRKKAYENIQATRNEYRDDFKLNLSDSTLQFIIYNYRSFRINYSDTIYVIHCLMIKCPGEVPVIEYLLDMVRPEDRLYVISKIFETKVSYSTVELCTLLIGSMAIIDCCNSFDIAELLRNAADSNLWFKYYFVMKHANPCISSIDVNTDSPVVYVHPILSLYASHFALLFFSIDGKYEATPHHVVQFIKHILASKSGIEFPIVPSGKSAFINPIGNGANKHSFYQFISYILKISSELELFECDFDGISSFQNNIDNSFTTIYCQGINKNLIIDGYNADNSRKMTYDKRNSIYYHNNDVVCITAKNIANVCKQILEENDLKKIVCLSKRISITNIALDIIKRCKLHKVESIDKLVNIISLELNKIQSISTISDYFCHVLSILNLYNLRNTNKQALVSIRNIVINLVASSDVVQLKTSEGDNIILEVDSINISCCPPQHYSQIACLQVVTTNFIIDIEADTITFNNIYKQLNMCGFNYISDMLFVLGSEYLYYKSEANEMLGGLAANITYIDDRAKGSADHPDFWLGTVGQVIDGISNNKNIRYLVVLNSKPSETVNILEGIFDKNIGLQQIDPKIKYIGLDKIKSARRQITKFCLLTEIKNDANACEELINFFVANEMWSYNKYTYIQENVTTNRWIQASDINLADERYMPINIVDATLKSVYPRIIYEVLANGSLQGPDRYNKCYLEIRNARVIIKNPHKDLVCKGYSANEFDAYYEYAYRSDNGFFAKFGGHSARRVITQSITKAILENKTSRKLCITLPPELDEVNSRVSSCPGLMILNFGLQKIRKDWVLLPTFIWRSSEVLFMLPEALYCAIKLAREIRQDVVSEVSTSEGVVTAPNVLLGQIEFFEMNFHIYWDSVHKTISTNILRDYICPAIIRRNYIITIDGLSGAGKTTTANLLQAAIKYDVIDIGLLYRAITLYILNKKIKLEDIIEHREDIIQLDLDYINSRVLLNNYDITELVVGSIDIESNVSKVSCIKYIRDKVHSIVRGKFGQKGLILTGRTCFKVFSEAHHKVYLDVPYNIRCKRMTNRIIGQENEISSLIKSRDTVDMTRQHDPLDSINVDLVIKSGHMDVEQVVNEILWRIHSVGTHVI